MKIKPDILVAPFDREEAVSIAIAGSYLRIPVAHLGAGDKTDYNVDGVVRHAVSKLSNLFFVSQMKMRKDYLRWVKIKNLFLKWAIQQLIDLGM